MTTTTTTTTGAAMKVVYDTEECTRCGGTGEYSWNQRTGSRCFKCNGRKTQLTRQAGKVQDWMQDWAEQHLTVAASTLEPGDRVVQDRVVWTVTERTTTLGKGNGTSRSGDTEWWSYGMTVLHLQRGARTHSFQSAAHWTVRRAWTNDTLAAALAECPYRKGYTVTGEGV